MLTLSYIFRLLIVSDFPPVSEATQSLTAHKYIVSFLHIRQAMIFGEYFQPLINTHLVLLSSDSQPCL